MARMEVDGIGDLKSRDFTILPDGIAGRRIHLNIGIKPSTGSIDEKIGWNIHLAMACN